MEDYARSYDFLGPTTYENSTLARTFWARLTKLLLNACNGFVHALNKWVEGFKATRL